MNSTPSIFASLSKQAVSQPDLPEQRSLSKTRKNQENTPKSNSTNSKDSNRFSDLVSGPPFEENKTQASKSQPANNKKTSELDKPVDKDFAEKQAQLFASLLAPTQAPLNMNPPIDLEVVDQEAGFAPIDDILALNQQPLGLTEKSENSQIEDENIFFQNRDDVLATDLSKLFDSTDSKFLENQNPQPQLQPQMNFVDDSIPSQVQLSETSELSNLDQAKLFGTPVLRGKENNLLPVEAQAQQLSALIMPHLIGSKSQEVPANEHPIFQQSQDLSLSTAAPVEIMLDAEAINFLQSSLDRTQQAISENSPSFLGLENVDASSEDFGERLEFFPQEQIISAENLPESPSSKSQLAPALELTPQDFAALQPLAGELSSSPKDLFKINPKQIESLETAQNLQTQQETNQSSSLQKDPEPSSDIFSILSAEALREFKPSEKEELSTKETETKDLPSLFSSHSEKRNTVGTEKHSAGNNLDTGLDPFIDQNKMANHVDRTRAANTKEFALEFPKSALAPNGLKVDMKVDNNNLDLTFKTDSSAAQKQFKNDEGLLREALAQHNIKLGDIRVEDAGRSSFGSSEHRSKNPVFDFDQSRQGSNQGNEPRGQNEFGRTKEVFSPQIKPWMTGRHRPVVGQGQSTIALRV